MNMNTTSTTKATSMKRILIALALFACIGSKVSAQTYRPLTGTQLVLNSGYPAGNGVTLVAPSSANYTLTLPSGSPSSNMVLANGAVAGTLEWKNPLDVYTVTNGLTELAPNTIKLGGTLTEATTIDLSNRTFTLSSTSPSGNVVINTVGDFSLTSSGLNVSNLGVISDAGGNVDITGNVLSTANGNYDLGADGTRWKSAYLTSDGVHIGSTYGASELLIGYSGGASGTAYFSVDGASSIMTLHPFDGLAVNTDVTLGEDDQSVLRFPGAIHPLQGSTDGTVFLFEGASNDLFETTIQVVDPTADNIIKIPDASGMLALTALDGSVVVVGSLTVELQTQLKGLMLLGDGESSDILKVNTADGPDLRLDETSLRRAAELTLEGKKYTGPVDIATDTLIVSSIQLGENMNLRSDGSITGESSVDINLIAVNQLEFGHANSAAERASLYMDDNEVSLSLFDNNDGAGAEAGRWKGLLQFDAITGEMTMLSQNFIDPDVAFSINASSGFLFDGTMNINTLGTAATTVGNTSSTVSVLGGLSVSLVVNPDDGTPGDYYVGYEAVVIQKEAQNVVLPAHSSGRVVVVKNASGNTIDVLDTTSAPILDDMADATSATLISDGVDWHQIGN